MANIPKIPNNFVIFGAIAAAALVVPGVVGALTFQEAYATHNDRHLSQAIGEVEQRARGGLAAVNANVQANVGVNVEDTQIAACVIVSECDPRN